MVRELKEFLTNRKYMITSICLIFAFFLTNLEVRNKVYNDVTRKADLTASNIAMNNITIVKNFYKRYKYKLEVFPFFNNLSDFKEGRVLNVLNNIQKNDSGILSAWYYKNNKFIYSAKANKEPYRKDLINGIRNRKIVNVKGPYINKDGKPVICMCVSIENNIGGIEFLGIDLDLREIHSLMSDNKDFLMAYVTVVSEDMKLIYHPNEKIIGNKLVDPNNIKKIQKVLLSQLKSEEKFFSDYLQMKTQRYYYPVDLGDGNKWVITASVPNLGFVESIDNIEKQMLILAILAFLSFILIFLSGMKRWRKEFISRKELEADNLKLQIENEQTERDLISIELENLKSGLNPHFLFNSLSSLIILVRKDTKLAGDFARALSKLYRYMLDYQKVNLVPFEDELDFAKDYIFLQQIRFKDKLFADFSFSLDQLSMKIPPISLQNLIENAIKHNEISRHNPLYIKVLVKDNMLIVENNLTKIKTMGKSSGKGHKNLIARYKLLSDRDCVFYESKTSYYAAIPLL